MRKDHTSVNRWTIKELVDAINGESSKLKVFIPPFQLVRNPQKCLLALV